MPKSYKNNEKYQKYVKKSQEMVIFVDKSSIRLKYKFLKKISIT